MSINSFSYVAPNQQVHLRNLTSNSNSQLTYSLMQPGLPSDGGCIWPHWSPDHKWLAYFQSGSETVSPSVSIVEVEGMEQRILAQENGALPIYACWAPDSSSLAVLYQMDELFIYVYDIDKLGEGKLVAEGAPLFFRWLPDSSALLLHSIRKRAGYSCLMVKSLLPYGEDYSLSQRPGGFCVPVYFDDRVIFVEGSREGAFVYQSSLEGNDKELIGSYTGIVAIQARPGRKELAISASPNGEGYPYNNIYLLDLNTNEQRCIVSGETQSFVWSPDGNKLVLSRVDKENRCMHWEMWDENNGHRYLHPFWPTREQIFHIHFFEQFSLSHGSISLDGSKLLYSGYRKRDFEESESLDAYLFITDLDTFETRPVCSGLFGSFPISIHKSE